MNQETWNECVKFHGHECPGLAIGYRASEIAMERMGKIFSADSDEKIVCVTENDACGVDAVQYLTGCTLGKGNLIFRPTGKMAFSFFCRDDGQSIRLILKPGITGGNSDRETARKFILEAPAEEVFSIGKPNFDLPERARLFNNLICSKCGESAPEHKMRFEDGQPVCIDCYQDYDNRW
jgi:formylmethanofuran dehydrogenase subunit E